MSTSSHTAAGETQQQTPTTHEFFLSSSSTMTGHKRHTEEEDEEIDLGEESEEDEDDDEVDIIMDDEETPNHSEKPQKTQNNGKTMQTTSKRKYATLQNVIGTTQSSSATDDVDLTLMDDENDDEHKDVTSSSSPSSSALGKRQHDTTLTQTTTKRKYATLQTVGTGNSATSHTATMTAPNSGRASPRFGAQPDFRGNGFAAGERYNPETGIASTDTNSTARFESLLNPESGTSSKGFLNTHEFQFMKEFPVVRLQSSLYQNAEQDKILQWTETNSTAILDFRKQHEKALGYMKDRLKGILPLEVQERVGITSVNKHTRSMEPSKSSSKQPPTMEDADGGFPSKGAELLSRVIRRYELVGHNVPSKEIEKNFNIEIEDGEDSDSSSASQDKKKKKRKRIEYYEEDDFIDDSELEATFIGRNTNRELQTEYYAAAEDEMPETSDVEIPDEENGSVQMERTNTGKGPAKGSKQSQNKENGLQTLLDFGDEGDIGGVKQNVAESVESVKRIRQLRADYMKDITESSLSEDCKRIFIKLEALCKEIFKSHLDETSSSIPEWNFHVDSLLLQLDVQYRKANDKKLEFKDVIVPWEPPKDHIVRLMKILPFPAATIQRHLRRLTEHQKCYISYCNLRQAYWSLRDWINKEKDMGREILNKSRAVRTLLTMCIDAQHELARAQSDYRRALRGSERRKLAEFMEVSRKSLGSQRIKTRQEMNQAHEDLRKCIEGIMGGESPKTSDDEFRKISNEERSRQKRLSEHGESDSDLPLDILLLLMASPGSSRIFRWVRDNRANEKLCRTFSTDFTACVKSTKLSFYSILSSFERNGLSFPKYAEATFTELVSGQKRSAVLGEVQGKEHTMHPKEFNKEDFL